MRLHEILQRKGGEVHTIGPAATLRDVVQLLVRYNIGSLIVCEAAAHGMDVRMIGIVTERDVLRAQAAREVRLADVSVADVMSSNLITARPHDEIEHAMRLMTKHRVRHLPVSEGDVLHGVISIGDVVKVHHDQLEMENHYMKSYIQGEGAEIATLLDCQ